MTMTAGDIILRAAELLHDPSYARWTQAMHFRFLTDAQNALVILRPDAHAVTAPIQLAASNTRQAIPSGGYKLLDIVRNMGAAGTTPGAPVTVVTRTSLDEANSAWHTDPASATVDHFCIDERNPTIFYVTPPPNAACYVEMVYSAPPAAITAMADLIGVNDVWSPALLQYQLYRAFSVNHASQADAQKAVAFLQSFYLILGETDKAKALYSPNMQKQV